MEERKIRNMRRVSKSLLLILILLFCLIAYSYSPRILSQITLDMKIEGENYDIEKDSEYINDFINSEYKYDKIESSYTVKGFDIRKNTFSFKNFASDMSRGGNCLGISLLEQKLFNGNLNLKEDGEYDLSFISKDLGIYRLSQEEINKIYKFQSTATDKPAALLTGIKKDNMTIEEIYSQKNSEAEYENVVSINEIESKEIREILKAISYFQEEDRQLSEKDYLYLPQINGSKESAKILKERYLSTKNIITRNNFYGPKINKDINPEEILHRIKNDKLVVLGVSKSFQGHAVLGYRYEKINDDTIKIYVVDNNFPLFENEAKYEEINNEIVNNMYILFKNTNDGWVFKYNPVINNKYIYSGIYTSYSPDAEFSIFKQ